MRYDYREKNFWCKMKRTVDFNWFKLNVWLTRATWVCIWSESIHRYQISGHAWGSCYPISKKHMNGDYTNVRGIQTCSSCNDHWKVTWLLTRSVIYAILHPLYSTNLMVFFVLLIIRWHGLYTRPCTAEALVMTKWIRKCINVNVGN